MRSSGRPGGGAGGAGAAGDGAAAAAGGAAGAALTHAVFDVDGTLFRGTTMYDFLDRYHRGRFAAGALLLASARVRGGPTAWSLVERALGFDALRALALRTLRGGAAGAIEAACRAYVAEVAPAELRPGVVARLERYRERGARIVLASASLEPLVAAVAAEVGAARWIAARPEVEDGRYTGRWSDDVRGRKLEALRRRIPDLGPFAVVTDNLDDGDLIAAAAETVVVSPPRHLARWRAVLPSGAEVVEG